MENHTSRLFIKIGIQSDNKQKMVPSLVILKIQMKSQVHWPMSIVPALRKLKQEDYLSPVV